MPGAYVNPFANVSMAPNSTFNIKPPLMTELTGFDLGGDLDSSSDTLEFDRSYGRRKRAINILDGREDGEIGPMVGLGESIGELNPSIPGLQTMPRGTNQKQK